MLLMPCAMLHTQKPDTMKPRVNNPAWVQAIQDVLDLVKANAYPPDQVNADPNATAFSQFLGGTGGALTWWGDVGSNARTSDTSVVGDVVGFSINPGAKRVYNSKAGAWEDKENFAPNMAYIGWGVYVTSRVSGDEKKRKAAWSAAAMRQFLVVAGDDLCQPPIAAAKLDDVPRAADPQHGVKADGRDVRLGEHVEQLGVQRALEQMERELRSVRSCELELHRELLLVRRTARRRPS